MKKLALYTALLIIIISVLTLAIYSLLFTGEGNPEETPLKAVIVDNLSITSPNQTFVSKAEKTLQSLNFKADWFPNETVTVDLYKKLTAYSIIILRVHSGILNDQVCLFTSEPYKEYEHSENGLARAEVMEKEYFGILPEFIEKHSEGTFPSSLVIAMGCSSSKTEAMAKAFIKKGARVYIGWSLDVYPSHTDNQITRLLQNLFVNNETVKEAVDDTTPDITGARLQYYPKNAADFRPLNFYRSSSVGSVKLSVTALAVFLENLAVQPVILSVSSGISRRFRKALFVRVLPSGSGYAAFQLR